MMIPLGEVALVSTSYPFRKKVDAEQGGDVAVIQMRDVDVDNAEGAIGVGAIMVRNDNGRYDRHLLKDGDLLFQSRGARHPVVVVRGGMRAIAGSGLHVIKPDRARVSAEYIAWWLNHPVSQTKLVADVARGTYVPFVSKADLEKFLVPLPPFALQHQIATVDHLRRRERMLAQRLDDLTKRLADGATFTAAVRNRSEE
jgi:hypothetical protein